MKGTKFGRMVVANDPDSSNLMMLLDWRVPPQLRMPHNKKQLSRCDRDAIRAWIKEGARTIDAGFERIELDPEYVTVLLRPA